MSTGLHSVLLPALMCAFAGAISIAPQEAHAEIRIVKANGDPVPAGAATQSFNPKTGGWTIQLLSLYAPNLDSVYEIRANAGEVIDDIFININGPAAGSPVIVRVYGEAPGYLRTVHNVTQLGNAESILNRVIVTEDIGSIQAEAIGDLNAGRDIIGPVSATTANNTARGITNVRAGRHILGDVTADHGRILVVSAPNGNVGTAQQPIIIRAKHSVYHITAQNLYADVNTRYNNGAGGIYALDVQRFFGTLVAEKMIFNPWTSTDGWMSISQQLGGTITFGKSLNNNAQWIQLPATGLANQIIVNADGVSGGSWTSPIRIGPAGPGQIVLNNPSYSQTPAMVGGGSVGLVPFRLHESACVPPSGSALTMANPASFTVKLQHYGPVTWEGGTPLPVIIERRPAGSFQSFVAAPINDFAVAAPVTSGRILTVGAAPNRAGFATGFEYRIRPSTQLRSDVPGLPPVQWSGDYHVIINAPQCACDINNDGLVNVPDLLSVISAWGAASHYPRADINGDGTIGVPDLLAVIGSWGACP